MPFFNLLLDYNNPLLDYNNLLVEYNNLLLDYNNPLLDYNNLIIIHYYYNLQININQDCPVSTPVTVIDKFQDELNYKAV